MSCSKFWNQTHRSFISRSARQVLRYGISCFGDGTASQMTGSGFMRFLEQASFQTNREYTQLLLATGDCRLLVWASLRLFSLLAVCLFILCVDEQAEPLNSSAPLARSDDLERSEAADPDLISRTWP